MTITPDKLKEMIQDMPMYAVPDKMECMKIAATLPNINLEQLIDNTEKIVEYLKKRIS